MNESEAKNLPECRVATFHFGRKHDLYSLAPCQQETKKIVFLTAGGASLRIFPDNIHTNSSRQLFIFRVISFDTTESCEITYCFSASYCNKAFDCPDQFLIGVNSFRREVAVKLHNFTRKETRYIYFRAKEDMTTCPKMKSSCVSVSFLVTS